LLHFAGASIREKDVKGIAYNLKPLGIEIKELQPLGSLAFLPSVEDHIIITTALSNYSRKHAKFPMQRRPRTVTSNSMQIKAVSTYSPNNK